MTTHKIVFLFDVDNTLLENDRVTADLKRHLQREVGAKRAEHYWAIFEQLRGELGYADYLGALQRYRIEYPIRTRSTSWNTSNNGDRSSYSRTATSSSNRAKWNAPACSKPWTATR